MPLAYGHPVDTDDGAAGSAWTRWRPGPRPTATTPTLLPVRDSAGRRWRAGDPAERAALLTKMLAADGPLVEPAAPGRCLVTFTRLDAGATHMSLWANHQLDPADPGRFEFTRLDGTDWWVLTLDAPDDWQTTYRVVTCTDGDPPWRRANADLRAIARGGGADPRTPYRVMGGSGLWLPAAGPPWPRKRTGAVPSSVTVAGERVWLTRTGSGERDPGGLVVVFDGAPHIEELATDLVLRAAHADGRIGDLWVVFVDSGDRPTREARLGVPGGLASVVAGPLLEALAQDHRIRAPSERTLVTGSSFGGLSTLFALGHARGRIGMGIAQSTSVWRYAGHDLAEVLAPASASPAPRLWLQAGRYEDDQVTQSSALADRLSARGIHASMREYSGGHDWAWWVPGLVDALAEAFPA